MKWSWRIGSIAGISVYVHATFLLLLAWIGFAGYRQGGSIQAAIPGIVFILSIFAIVVLHELGHALTARRFGVGTREITLLPIGGIARLERMPKEPSQELLIAIAGPAVNVVLAIALYLLLLISGGPPTGMDATSITAGFTARSYVTQLLAVNILIALFNMIPAFPMDGGRVLRAALAMRTKNYARATETAARVGRFFALVFGLVGLFVLGNPFLVFIALFVWLGAAGEAQAVQTSTMLEGVPLEQVMIRDFRTLAPADPLSRAVALMLEGFQQDFPVVENGQAVGVLTRTDLMRGLSEAGPSSPVDGVMHREFDSATPDELVEEALGRLRASECPAMPVVSKGEIVGVLTTENVGEFVMVRAALGGATGKYAPA